MSDRRGTSLTRHEFDAVIRRAAELASSDSGDGDLTEAELYRIAGDVGLPESHVRRALAEVRAGETGGGVMDRVFGPLFIRAHRVVPGAPAELAKVLDDFLVGTQLLQPVRRGPTALQYRPALDWASQLARAASFSSRKYYIASAKSVEVHLEEVEEGRTRIELIVDPGTRADAVGGAVVGGGTAGVVTGGFAGWSVGMAIPVLGLAIGTGVLLGAGVTAGVTYFTGQSHKKKLAEVRTELEGVLDTLEMGESLEPPPASWRRWVKRHFHGVARDLMGTEDELGD